MFAFRSQQLAKTAGRRTFLVTKNNILERQRIMQRGSTPYLRGWDDPTFLRLPYDYAKGYLFAFATTLGWLWALSAHKKMWVGDKGQNKK